MSRIFRVRFACLATAISLAAVATLALAAVTGEKPIVPTVHRLPVASTASPVRTPSPEAGSIPTAASASGDLLRGGLSLPGVLALLAVAALMGGISVMISRGPSATRRVSEQLLTVGKAVQLPSGGVPAKRAA